MRIISQDGCYDMPYEQTMLTNIGTKIYADGYIRSLRCPNTFKSLSCSMLSPPCIQFMLCIDLSNVVKQK